MSKNGLEPNGGGGGSGPVSSSPLQPTPTKSHSILNLSLKKGSRLSLSSLSSTIGRSRSKKVTKEIRNNTQEVEAEINGNLNNPSQINGVPYSTSNAPDPEPPSSLSLEKVGNETDNHKSSPTGSSHGHGHSLIGGGGHSGNSSRFHADGLTFKGKLIGILEVSGPRGDRLCQEALSELKMAVKAAGEHKQKILININLDGIRIRDEKTGDSLHHHLVHRISFIAQDLTDSRAFGYIFGSPETGHRFFGIKTEKNASTVVMAMRDLFQVVFDLKKKEIERAKERLGGGLEDGTSGNSPSSKVVTYLVTRSNTPGTGFGAAGVSDALSKVDQKLINLESNSGSPSNSLGGGEASAVHPTAQSSSSSAAGGGRDNDLLNLEVELSSLQTGLDQFKRQFPQTAPLAQYYNEELANKRAKQEMTDKIAFMNARPTGTPCPSAPDAFGMESFVPPSQSLRSTTIGEVCPPLSIIEDPFKNIDPFGGGRYDEPPGFGEETDLGSGTISLPMDPFDTSAGSGSLFNNSGSGENKASWEASFDDDFSHQNDISVSSVSVAHPSITKPLPQPLASELFSDLDPLFSCLNKSTAPGTQTTTTTLSKLPKIPSLVPPPTSTSIKPSFSSNFSPPTTQGPEPTAVPSPKVHKLKNFHVTVSCTLPRGGSSGDTDISNFKLPRPTTGGSSTGSLSRRTGKYGRYESPPGQVPSALPPSPPPRPPITLLSQKDLFPEPSPTALVPPPLPPKKQSHQTIPHNFTFRAPNHHSHAHTIVTPTFSNSKPPAQQPLPLPPPSKKSFVSTAPASAPSPQPSISTLITELSQLSLSELGTRLALPVEELSQYSIRELALQLQEKKLRDAVTAANSAPPEIPEQISPPHTSISIAPAPPPASRYEVFRELDNLSTHSGFSVNSAAGENGVIDSEDYTLVQEEGEGGTLQFHTANQSTPSIMEDNTLNDVSDDEFAPTLLEDIDDTTTAPNGAPKDWACFDNYGLIEGVNEGDDIEEIGLEPLSIGWDDEGDEDDEEQPQPQALPKVLKQEPPPTSQASPPVPPPRPTLSEESHSHSSKYTTEEEDDNMHVREGSRRHSREDQEENDYHNKNRRRRGGPSGRRSRGGYEDDVDDDYYYDSGSRPSSGRVPSVHAHGHHRGRRYAHHDDFEDDRSYRSSGGGSRRGPVDEPHSLRRRVRQYEDEPLASPKLPRRRYYENDREDERRTTTSRRRIRKKSHEFSYSEEDDTEDSNSYYSSTSSQAHGRRRVERDREHPPPRPRARNRTISDEEDEEEESHRRKAAKYKYYDDYEDDGPPHRGGGRRGGDYYRRRDELVDRRPSSRPNSGRRDDEFYSISRGNVGRRHSNREDGEEYFEDEVPRRRRSNYRDVFEEDAQPQRRASARNSESPRPPPLPTSAPPTEEEMIEPNPPILEPATSPKPAPIINETNFFDDNFSPPVPFEPVSILTSAPLQTPSAPTIQSSIDTIPEEEAPDEEDPNLNQQIVNQSESPEMKKSDSFNIFGHVGVNPIEFDPFKDDDFFN